MRIYLVGVLFLAGVVLASHHRRHEPMEYAMSGESVGTIDYDPHQAELRQVVRSLKDLKSCLCKLISVQKKQIELELSRCKAKDSNDVEIGQVSSAQHSTLESSSAAPVPVVNEANGASVDIKFDHHSTTELPTSTMASTTDYPTTTDESRNKRHSDFVEIHPVHLERLSKKGFRFESDEESEKTFLGEQAAGLDVAAITATVTVDDDDEEENKDRKVRGIEADNESNEGKEEDEESSVESPAHNLSRNYEHMEKTKGLTRTSLPRKESLEFPNGATYYSTGDDQKPIDYTLNIPQQTYYLVPGPNPGQSALVTAPYGNYGPVTKSLSDQFAPSSTAGDHHIEIGQAEEEKYVPEDEPPKEVRKRRRNKKKAAESTTSAFES